MIAFVILPFTAFLSMFCLKDVHRINAEDPTVLKSDARQEKEQKKKREDWLVIKTGKRKNVETEEKIQISYGPIQSAKEQFREEIKQR
jgi:kynurenine formamidase